VTRSCCRFGEYIVMTRCLRCDGHRTVCRTRDRGPPRRRLRRAKIGCLLFRGLRRGQWRPVFLVLRDIGKSIAGLCYYYFGIGRASRALRGKLDTRLRRYRKSGSVSYNDADFGWELATTYMSLGSSGLSFPAFSMPLSTKRSRTRRWGVREGRIEGWAGLERKNSWHGRKESAGPAL